MPRDQIVSDPKIMMGKPTIAGTRITVELILDKLAAGETEAQILSEHPHLTAESIRAAIAFAHADTTFDPSPKASRELTTNPFS